MVTQEQLAQAILDLKQELKQSSVELRQELKQSSVELRQELKQSSLELKQSNLATDKSLDKIGKMVGGISNNQGDIAEEFFLNSLRAKPVLNNITYDFLEANATRYKGNIGNEYDILMVNGADVAIIETKYKAHKNDIKFLLDKKYKNFKKLYPQYKNHHHHLYIASFNVNDDVKQFALSNNVSVLQRKGKVIETISAE